jgi:hypothetical protein
MAGRLISVIGKNTFTPAFLAAGNANSQLGNRFYDVRDAVSGVLLVRVVSASAPAGGSFQVGVANAMVMPDDPATIYGINSGTVAIANVTIATTDTFPRLYAAGFTASTSPPCGPMVGFALTAVSGGNAGSGSIVLAVDLLIRDT